MKREQLPAWLMAIAMTTSTASCCLQTVTGIHDNSQGADAGADAGIDAGFDAGIDAGLDSGTVVGPCGPASDMNATVTYFLPIPGGSGDAGLEVTTMASGEARQSERKSSLSASGKSSAARPGPNRMELHVLGSGVPARHGCTMADCSWAATGT